MISLIFFKSVPIDHFIFGIFFKFSVSFLNIEIDNVINTINEAINDNMDNSDDFIELYLLAKK